MDMASVDSPQVGKEDDNGAAPGLLDVAAL